MLSYDAVPNPVSDPRPPLPGPAMAEEEHDVPPQPETMAETPPRGDAGIP